MAGVRRGQPHHPPGVRPPNFFVNCLPSQALEGEGGDKLPRHKPPRKGKESWVELKATTDRGAHTRRSLNLLGMQGRCRRALPPSKINPAHHGNRLIAMFLLSIAPGHKR